MEAYAYEGYKTIRPAFYDVLLQGKIVRDDQSLEMLDFIFDNITYDVGNIFNFDMYSFDLMNLTIKYNLDVASFIASREPSAQTALDALMNELSK